MRKYISPTRFIALGFVGIIFAGALLLSLPFASHRDGSFLTALFTSASATCVTGLVLHDTLTYWTPFGQIVILLLIQIGGLGFMTVTTVLAFALGRRIGLRERLLIVHSMNLTDTGGVVRLMRHVLAGTLIFEGMGAIILTICFVPGYGLWGGLCKGVFHAVSAFCNAGFDIFGEPTLTAPLAPYAQSPVAIVTVCMLMTVGSLGFVVWEDIYRRIRDPRPAGLQVHTRIVLLVTAVLTVSGAAAFCALEWSNGGTIGGMPVWRKILTSLFLSLSQRTAGFAAVDQGLMTGGSKLLTMILMFIGGSPGSTAGGIKTVTVAVLLAAAWGAFRGRADVNIFKRRVSARRVRDCTAIFLLLLVLAAGAAMLFIAADGADATAAAFEAVSAIGTGGLTLGLTPELGTVSRLALIALMFVGKVGIMTFGISSLAAENSKAKIRYPETRIMIG